MAETDITLSIDLDVKDAEKTAKHLQKEIKNIFESRNRQSSPRLTSLQIQMKKAVQEADKLQKKLASLKDQKVPTKEYSELSKQLYKLESEASGLTRKMKEFEKSGGNTVSQKYQEWERRIEQIGIETSKVIDKMEHLESTNMAYKQGYQTEEYAETERKLDAVNDKLKQQIIQYREVEDKEENAGKKGEGAFTALISKASALLAVLKAIGKVVMWLPTKVWNTGKKFYTSVFQKLISGTKSIISGIRKITVSAGKLFNKFNIFSKGNNSPVKQLLRNILRYGLGISSIMVLFSKLRNNITGNLKDIIAKSGEAKTAYDNLKLSIGQLSHQVSAIFEPVLRSLEPLLTMIIERLNQAALAVTKFIGAITGQSKILKARKNLNALADSAGEASKQLSSLDNLNVLSSDKGGGAGTGDADWYDWEDVDPKYLDFWKKLREEWEKDVPDFTWLGKMLADKITNALSNIDWAKIFKNAMKLGVSLATFLNGFFDEDMLKALGEAIANAINTAIYFAWSFVEAFDFWKFGTSIGKGFVNLVNGIDWEALTEAIKLGFDGVLGAIRNFVNTIIDRDNGIDFTKLRVNLENAIINTFNSLTSFVQNLHWATLKDRIIEFFSFDVTAIAKSVSNFLNELAQQDVIRNFTDIVLSLLGSTSPREGRGTIFDEDGNIMFQELSGAKPMGGSSSGLAGFFEQLIENTDIDTIVSDIADLFVRILNRVRDNITDLMSTIADNVDAANLGTAIHDIIDSVLNLGIAILTNEKFQAWVQEVLDNVNIDELAEKFGKLVLGAWELIRDIIPWEQLTPVISQIISDIWNIGSEIVYDALDKSGIGELIIQGLKTGLVRAAESILLGPAGAVAAILQIISDGFIGEKDDDSNSLSDAGDNIIKGLERGLLIAATNILLGPVGTIATIVALFCGKFRELLGIASPSTVFEEYGQFIIEGLILGFQNKLQALHEKMNEIKTKLVEKAEEWRARLQEKWTEIKENASTIWDNIKTTAEEKWTALKDKIIEIVEAVKEGIKNPINGIISAFETMVNGVISGLNAMIQKLNSLTFNVPKWVPLIGGESFNLNIPELQTVSIPRLAQGAVIPPNREFLAMLGDQTSGTNIETPLDTMKQAFREVIESMNVGGNQEIVINLDGREFLRAMVKQNNEYKKQHNGISALA